MSESTRRRFLIASGAGAAAVGVAAAVPGVAAAQPAERPAAPTTLPGDAQSLVAHVSDPSSGTVTLFLAEHEVVVHDPDLVARLARAATAKSANAVKSAKGA